MRKVHVIAEFPNVWREADKITMNITLKCENFHIEHEAAIQHVAPCLLFYSPHNIYTISRYLHNI